MLYSLFFKLSKESFLSYLLKPLLQNIRTMQNTIDTKIIKTMKRLSSRKKGEIEIRCVKVDNRSSSAALAKIDQPPVMSGKLLMVSEKRLGC